MAENNITIIDNLLKNMDHVINSKTVVGEATKVGDATIVPLVDVSFGAAAGTSSKEKRNGGAGGLHANISPSAVLVIQNGHVKVVPVKGQDTVSKVIDMVPELIDKFKAKKEGGISDEEAVENAFPDEN